MPAVQSERTEPSSRPGLPEADAWEIALTLKADTETEAIGILENKHLTLVEAKVQRSPSAQRRGWAIPPHNQSLHAIPLSRPKS